MTPTPVQRLEGETMRYAIVVAVLLSVPVLSAVGQAALPGQDAVGVTQDQRPVAPASGGTVVADELDLNTADQIALETLPGIGPKTAALILEYRTDNGAFSKEEELMNIRGIGERTFLRLRGLVRVGHVDEKP